MSSEEDTTSPPYVNAQERHKRHRRTPKHLEDYILAYHHRGPALSSNPDNGEHEEQRGAAATADSGQADVGFLPGTSRASHSPSPGASCTKTYLDFLLKHGVCSNQNAL